MRLCNVLRVPRGHLAGREQVPQIGPGKVPAGVAPARRIGRPSSSANCAFLMLSGPSLVKHLAVAGVAGGQHAVEHVDAPGDALDEVDRACRPPSGSVAVVREKRRRVLHDLVHGLDRLADAEAADGVGLEPDDTVSPALFSRSSGNIPPWTMPNWAWPGRSERSGARPCCSSRKRFAAAARPAAVSSSDAPMTSAVAGSGRALVEHHRDVGAQVGLDVDGFLGRQQVGAAVEVRPEARAVLLYLAAVRG